MDTIPLTDYEQELYGLVYMQNLALVRSQLKDGTNVAILAVYEFDGSNLTLHPLGIMASEDIVPRMERPDPLDYIDNPISKPFEENDPNMVTLRTSLDGEPFDLLAYQSISEESIKTAPVMLVINDWLAENLVRPPLDAPELAQLVAEEN